MIRQLICTTELDSSFPFSMSTLQSGFSRGRYRWIRRLGPDGHRGRYLWIDCAEFNDWAAMRGIKFRFRLQPARAAELGAQH